MRVYFLFRTLLKNGTLLSVQDPPGKWDNAFKKIKYSVTIIFGIIFVLVLILGFRSPPEEQDDEIASQRPAVRTEWRNESQATT